MAEVDQFWGFNKHLYSIMFHTILDVRFIEDINMKIQITIFVSNYTSGISICHGCNIRWEFSFIHDVTKVLSLCREAEVSAIVVYQLNWPYL